MDKNIYLLKLLVWSFSLSSHQTDAFAFWKYQYCLNVTEVIPVLKKVFRLKAGAKTSYIASSLRSCDISLYPNLPIIFWFFNYFFDFMIMWKIAQCSHTLEYLHVGKNMVDCTDIFTYNQSKNCWPHYSHFCSEKWKNEFVKVAR